MRDDGKLACGMFDAGARGFRLWLGAAALPGGGRGFFAFGSLYADDFRFGSRAAFFSPSSSSSSSSDSVLSPKSESNESCACSSSSCSAS